MVSAPPEDLDMFPALTRQLTTLCNVSATGPDALSGLCGTRYTCIHVGETFIHITMDLKIFLKPHLLRVSPGSSSSSVWVT